MVEMPRGRPKGYPRTGGRKAGTPNKRTAELQAKRQRAVARALSAPMTPLDIMAAKMNGEPLPDGRIVTDSMFAAAVAAAPYIHPRLASTDTTIKSDNVHRLLAEKPKSEAEWMAEHATAAMALPPLPANDAITIADDEEIDSAADTGT